MPRFCLLVLLALFGVGSCSSAMPGGVRMPTVLSKLRMSPSSTTAAAARGSTRLGATPRTRVVTDIDDTVKSSGGVNIFGISLGGIDTQFKRGEFYPGVFQFLLELSKGMSVSKSFAPEKVGVLTARAREFKFALALKPKDKLCTAFREAGKMNGLVNWGIGPVYYGSVAEWILQERKGLRKFSNFEKMMREDTLCSGAGAKRQYILVGDTGEKDEEAGERIIAKYPRAVRAVFLHVVSKEKDRSRVVLPRDRKLNGVPVLYFRTYVGAAQKAMQHGLITGDGLLRVVKAARQDLGQLLAEQGQGQAQVLGGAGLVASVKSGAASSAVVAAAAASSASASASASASVSSSSASASAYSASRVRELEQDVASALAAKDNRVRLSLRVDRRRTA